MAAEFIHYPLLPEQEPVDDLYSFWRPLTLRNESGGLPEGRCSHSSTLVNGFVYLIGGGCLNVGVPLLNRFKHFSEVWRVNPETGGIENLPTTGDVFLPRRGHSADVYLDRYIVVFGGVVNSNEGEETLSHDLYVFDTALFTWKLFTKEGTPNFNLLDWPTPRRGHETCIYKKKLYIMGGMISREPPEDVQIDIFFRQYVRVLSTLFYVDLEKLFEQMTGGGGLEGPVVPSWKTKWMISYDKISAFVMSNRFGPTGVSISDILFSMSQSELVGDRWYLWGGTLAQAGTKAGAYYIDLATDCEFHHLAYCGQALVDARNTDHKLSVEETPNQDLYADMPHARFSPAMCPLLDGEVLALFGGSNIMPVGNMETLDEFFSLTIIPGTVPTGRSHVIAPLDAKFRSLENKIYKAPPPRNGAMLTALSPTSAMLSFGGKYGEVYLDDVWLLEIVRVPRSSDNSIIKQARDSNLEQLSFYRTLLDDQKWTDVTLTFDDGEHTICAHRIVLASRSSYFKALFAGSFAETDKVVVRLSGMEYEAAKVLIEFIYTGSFSSGTFSSPSFTAELLSLSEQLLEGKAFERCSAALINHVLPVATSCSTDLENLKFILDNINLADSLGQGGESLLERLTQCLKIWLFITRSQFPHLWAGLEPRLLEIVEQSLASSRLKEATAKLVHSS